MSYPPPGFAGGGVQVFPLPPALRGEGRVGEAACWDGTLGCDSAPGFAGEASDVLPSPWLSTLFQSCLGDSVQPRRGDRW